MRRTIQLLSVFFTLTLFLAGCASNNPKPNLSGTVTNSGVSQRSDYIPLNESDIYSPGDRLQERTFELNSGSGFGQGEGQGALGQGGNIAGTGGNPNALARIYFGFNQSAIKQDERHKLNSLAQDMQSDPNIRLLVEGHCDWRGTVEYNIALGERRAKSVVRYLKNLGVPDNRFETLSKGDLEALVEGTASQMAQDRRVDIIPLR